MGYNKEQIAGKLLRWEKFLNGFDLPSWDQLPQIDLYMDQVIALLNNYLGFFIYEGNDEKLLTPAMVNNYVKMKLLAPPIKKKYGRKQVASLIMICTLKQTLSMAQVKQMLPRENGEGFQRDYDQFVQVHKRLSLYFTQQVKASAAPVFDTTVDNGSEVNDLVVGAAVAASFAKLMAGKIVALKLPEPELEKSKEATEHDKPTKEKSAKEKKTEVEQTNKNA